jgi:hypothetical protein
MSTFENTIKYILLNSNWILKIENDQNVQLLVETTHEILKSMRMFFFSFVCVCIHFFIACTRTSNSNWNEK